MSANPFLFSSPAYGGQTSRIGSAGCGIQSEGVFDHAGDSQNVTLGKCLGDSADADCSPGVMSGIAILIVFDGEVLLHFLEHRGKQRRLELLGSAAGALRLKWSGELSWGLERDLGWRRAKFVACS